MAIFKHAIPFLKRALKPNIPDMSNCSRNSLLLPLPPDHDALPPLLSRPNGLLASKKTTPNLVSATLSSHKTCSVSPLFLSAVPTLPSEGMPWRWLAVLGTFLAQPKPSDGLTRSNAEQALQQPVGRALLEKKCQLEMQ